ncbi:hypothetical protein MHYP_G00276740 [Metynnis hypsauchen]
MRVRRAGRLALEQAEPLREAEIWRRTARGRSHGEAANQLRARLGPRPERRERKLSSVQLSAVGGACRETGGE